MLVCCEEQKYYVFIQLLLYFLNKKHLLIFFMVLMLVYPKSSIHGPCKLPLFMHDFSPGLAAGDQIQKCKLCLPTTRNWSWLAWAGQHDLPLGPFTQLTLSCSGHTVPYHHACQHDILPSRHKHQFLNDFIKRYKIKPLKTAHSP